MKRCIKTRFVPRDEADRLLWKAVMFAAHYGMSGSGAADLIGKQPRNVTPKPKLLENPR